MSRKKTLLRNQDDDMTDVSLGGSQSSSCGSVKYIHKKMYFIFAYIVYLVYLVDINEKKTSDFRIQNYSQVSSSQASKAVETLGLAEFKRLVADMVRYMLFSDRKKVGIKKADMVKDVIKDHSKAFPLLFKETKEKLREAFGFDVVELLSEDGKSKGFVLINLLEENPGCESLLDWGKESEKMGLLMIIVSMIFMNDGVLNEASLWYCLKKLGIERTRKHRVFGDVDKLINTEFVKQNYLERKKLNSTDGPSFQYIFGARTSAEIGKRKILQFVSKIYGVESIESWKVQYQDVVAAEQRVP